MKSLRAVRRLVGLLGVAVAVSTACIPQAAPPSTTTTSTTTTSSTTTTTTPPDVSTVTPNPVPVDASVTTEQFPIVTVHYAGVEPGADLYIEQCRTVTSLSADCSYFQPLVVFSNSNASGNVQFQLFRGAEPGDNTWGCYAPTDTAQPGIEFDTTCYVRITDIFDGNTAQQQLLPFTFVGQ